MATAFRGPARAWPRPWRRWPPACTPMSSNSAASRRAVARRLGVSWLARPIWPWLGLGALLILALVLGLGIGAVSLSPGQVLRALLRPASADQTAVTIV